MKTMYWTQDRIAEMRGYSSRGLTSNEVAKKFSKTSTAIRKQANKYGITFRGQFNNWTNAEDRLLREMVAEGFGWKDIARKLQGRSENAVTGYANRNNIKFLGVRGPKPYRYAKPKKRPAPPVLRKCLGPCGRYFESAWIGNRICKSCKGSGAFTSGAMA